MVLKQGEKIHLIVRRNFESDIRRHFVGEVVDVDNLVARISGYAFVLDNMSGQFIRRNEKRTRIISLTDAGNIINVIPREADIDGARYTQSAEGKLVVSDGKSFSLDVNEFGASR